MVSITKFTLSTCHCFCLFNCHFILLMNLGVALLQFPCFHLGRHFRMLGVLISTSLENNGSFIRNVSSSTNSMRSWRSDSHKYIFWLPELFCSICPSVDLATSKSACTTFLKYSLHSTAGYQICFHTSARGCKTLECFGITKFDLGPFLFFPSIW